MKEELLKRRQALKVAVEHFGSRHAMAEALGVSVSYANRWFSREGFIPFKTAYQIDLATKSQVSMSDLTGHPIKRVKLKTAKEAIEAIERAVEHFGGIFETADALGVRYDAVRAWLKKEHIPFERAYQIDVLTRGKIKLSELIPDMPVKVCTYKK